MAVLDVKTLAATLLGFAVAVPALAEPDAPPSGVALDPTVEVIKERDNAGRVRVRREVRLNEAGDFVNHGGWRAWDAEGRLVGQGRYAWGKPTGVWCRWASEDDAPLLRTASFAGFTPPYLSQATFRDGKLEGLWAIFDTDGRQATEVNFREGKRHGAAVLYLADGSVHRRARYEEGVPVGKLEERNGDTLVVVAEYEHGRARIERTERHEQNGNAKIRESWLGPQSRVVAADDPWRLRLASYAAVGEEIRHGRREAWWPNGQRKLLAEYRLGSAVGEARWWHANGQLALRGGYAGGLAAGDWSWWREDGSRMAEQTYVAGKAVSVASAPESPIRR